MAVKLLNDTFWLLVAGLHLEVFGNSENKNFKGKAVATSSAVVLSFSGFRSNPARILDV